ncbi:MAG: hypothetical protein HY644_15310 [Acidobacteria bacterium]|nr:hypothetical protein [Acidobacteriota bacterium]
MPQFREIVYEILRFEKGWKIVKQDSPLVIATSGTVDAALSQLELPPGVPIRIRVFREDGTIAELHGFSPEQRGLNNRRSGESQ